MSAMTLLPWRIVASREVYAAQPWMRVALQTVQLPDGRLVNDYHQIQVQEHCVIYAETAEGKIIVERQYKHGARSVGLSLPAGALAAGEDAKAAAARELLEETGYAAEDWQQMGVYAAHGNYGCGRAHMFKARNAIAVATPNSGDLEEIEVLLLDRADLISALHRGEVHLMGSVAAIGLANLGVD
jgi:ADP-ribose pyrophosphatase